jgi:glycosyltransferase involved in cell wall biosynthesis
VRIGVNALYLIPGGVGGTEIYLRHLLDSMARLETQDEVFVFTNRETGPDLVPAAAGFHHRPLPVSATSRPARLFYEQTSLPVEARTMDVLFNPGFTGPWHASCPQVTVFHDLQHVRHPEFFRWWDLPFWKLFLRMSVRSSRLLIAVSEATRVDLLDHYGVGADRVRVVPHGVDECFFTLPRRPDPNLLLCVSTLHPHKNLDRLLRVFARLHGRMPPLRLVVAGMRGHHSNHLEAMRRELHLEDSVAFPGWVSRKELLALYGEAGTFVFPSRFEGFGMPVLEALAAGIPAAVSAVEPMASVAGSAAALFDPLSDEDMEQVLEQVLTDPATRATLAAAGPQRASGYSWDHAAQLTRAALREACRF